MGGGDFAAARRGARVTATDFVTSMLEVAERRAQSEGLELATGLADAQALPFDDGSFDVVISTFGAMFAPDQQQTADELLRVCRPGGRIGMANWTPDGLVGGNLAITVQHLQHLPHPPQPSDLRPAVEWGTETRLRELFTERISELRVERRSTDMCAPSAADQVAFNRAHLGPTRAAFEQLGPDDQARLAAELARDLERVNRATDGTLLAAADYLEIVAVKAWA